MTEFWESSFIDKQTMWGLEPTESALYAKDFFIAKNVKEILLPGVGYGRNAKVFLDSGINVTGIEISKTAIELAKKKYKLDINIYHGSVNDMPFDDKQYDGIYSFALIHLLNNRERKKLIANCYQQLKPGGYMIMVTISKQSPMYTVGQIVSRDRFELIKGVKLFFFDAKSIRQEFKNYFIEEIKEIDEPDKNTKDKPPQKFLMIKCKKM